MNGADGVRHLLVRMPSWVGDAVMATPALRALRQRFPEAQVTLHGRPHLRPLLEGADLFDEWLAVHGGPGRVRANVAELRKAGADLAVILPHSFRTGWEVFRSGIPRRLGYRREGRGWLLTQSLSPHRQRGRLFPVPMVHQYLELVAVLGATGDEEGPRLGIPDSVREVARATLERLGLKSGDSFVAFNPGASYGPSKVYPVASLARVADILQREDGLRALLLCGPGEEPLARELEAHMETVPVTTAEKPVPLDELKAVLERADLLVTTDTGPRHIAVAVGTPAVVLMGSTDPRYTNSHLGPTIVLRKDVDCSPCHHKVCPIDHRCMTRIGPDEVVEAARKLLRRQGPSAG